MNNPAKIFVAEKGRQKRFAVSDRGFTLLELLISITVLAFIVVIMMGAMRMGSRAVAAGERKMEGQERLRTVFSLVDAQVQSQVPLTYEDDGYKKYYFTGDEKNLRFTTNYSIWGGQKGYVIVTYKVEADNTGKDVLYASERVPGIEGSLDTRLIEAYGISFGYFYKNPAEEQGKWMDMLTEGTSIPEKIRINIGQGIKKISVVFPLRVGGEIMAVKSKAPISAGPGRGI